MTPTSLGLSPVRSRGPDALIETCTLKAELAFGSLDVELARWRAKAATGRSNRVPLVPSGGRDHGLHRPQARSQDHRKRWPRIAQIGDCFRFKAGDPAVRAAVAALGFPEFGVFVISSTDPSKPVKDLTVLDDVVTGRRSRSRALRREGEANRHLGYARPS